MTMLNKDGGQWDRAFYTPLVGVNITNVIVICNDNVMIANDECLLCVKPYKHASVYLAEQPYEIDIDILVLHMKKLRGWEVQILMLTRQLMEGGRAGRGWEEKWKCPTGDSSLGMTLFAENNNSAPRCK